MPRDAAAEWVSVEELTPWSENPRHNEAAIARVAESIRRFGFGAPIVARKADGEIIAGHTRYQAALRLGLKSVPTRLLDLDPAEAHLLAIADNKLAEVADWDDPALAGVLREFTTVDAELAGFSLAELEKLTADGEPAEELNPAEGNESTTRPPILWFRTHPLMMSEDEAERLEILFGVAGPGLVDRMIDAL